MKHTPLYDQHIRDASVVINLKGFARAMQYRGHVAEHRGRARASACAMFPTWASSISRARTR